jgi:hypothetical protein
MLATRASHHYLLQCTVYSLMEFELYGSMGLAVLHCFVSIREFELQRREKSRYWSCTIEKVTFKTLNIKIWVQ